MITIIAISSFMSFKTSDSASCGHQQCKGCSEDLKGYYDPSTPLCDDCLTAAKQAWIDSMAERSRFIMQAVVNNHKCLRDYMKEDIQDYPAKNYGKRMADPQMN